MRSYFIIVCLGLTFTGIAQNNISQKIQARKQTGKIFNSYTFFGNGDLRSDQKSGGDYKAFTLNRGLLQQFMSTKPEQFSITISGISRNYTLLLIKVFILDPSIKLLTADSSGEHPVTDYEFPAFYHGIIEGAGQDNFVAATITASSLHFFIAAGHENIQVGPTDEHVNSSSYGVFENLTGNNGSFPFSCGTKDKTPEIQSLSNSYSGDNMAVAQAFTSKLVRCFFDCAYTFYQQNGSSVTNTFNRMTTLFNEAALIYANESINTAISEIRVWTSFDPYTHSTREAGLPSFKNSIKNNYNGNLAMLCDFTASGTGNSGLADGIGVLCQTYGTNDGPYIYNDFNYNNTYSNFPVTADAPPVYLIVHEMGHVLGSHHTHWCGWVGGPIDNCASVEGPCLPGPTPTQGTMMSYCCTNTAIGVNFNSGFGTQPGNAIRTHINGSSCLGNGTAICDSTMYLINPINNSDFTKFEVSNMITASCTVSSSGNVLFDAGKIARLIPGFIAPIGSNLHIVNEGCGGASIIINPPGLAHPTGLTKPTLPNEK